MRPFSNIASWVIVSLASVPAVAGCVAGSEDQAAGAPREATAETVEAWDVPGGYSAPDIPGLCAVVAPGDPFWAYCEALYGDSAYGGYGGFAGSGPLFGFGGIGFVHGALGWGDHGWGGHGCGGHGWGDHGWGGHSDHDHGGDEHWGGHFGGHGGQWNFGAGGQGHFGTGGEGHFGTGGEGHFGAGGEGHSVEGGHSWSGGGFGSPVFGHASGGHTGSHGLR
jgi:hypothetical protein